MDPISITGTVIAVVQITSSVISICYDYRSSAKGSTREIIQITDELNSLKDVLESLLRVVEKAEEDESRNDGKLATFQLLLKEEGPLATCKQELVRLKGKLEPEKGWRKVRQNLTWPLKEGEMRRALEACECASATRLSPASSIDQCALVERLKGTMSLALSTDQMYVD